MIVIKVLGTGCPNCQKLEALAKEAVREAGVDADIQKVTEINTIVSYGVLRTPSLVINDEIKSQGKIPDVDTIKQWIHEAVREN